MQALGLWLLLAVAAFGHSAAAQDLCVQCDGPSAMYRCSIADIDKAGSFPGRGKAIEYVCLTQLARQGPHERCRVSHNHGNVCLGDQRTVSWETPRDGQAPAAAVPPTKVERPTNEPPRTLAEVARNTVEGSKQAVKKTGEQIEQAGDAVGGAMKKTWSCLITLFSAC